MSSLICGAGNLTANIAGSCGPVGGVGKKVYIFNKDGINVSYNADGSVSGVTLNTCAKGYTFTGYVEGNNTVQEMTRVNSAPFYNPSVILRGSYSTQAQLNAVNSMLKASELVAFVEENSGETYRFNVFGLVAGLTSSGAPVNSNQNKNEPKMFEATLSGTEPDLAPYFVPAGATTHAAVVAVLEGLTTLASPSGVLFVETGNNGYSFESGDTITIKGCGFIGVTNVSIGGRSTNPSTGSGYNSTMVVEDDNTITIQIGSDGGATNTTNGAAVTLTKPGGNITYTNPVSIFIRSVGSL